MEKVIKEKRYEPNSEESLAFARSIVKAKNDGQSPWPKSPIGGGKRGRPPKNKQRDDETANPA